MTILTGETIKRMCQGDKPLIRNMVDLETQLQQNGIDLTLKKIERFSGRGTIDFDNSKRQLPPMHELPVIHGNEGLHFYNLFPGSYLVTFNEIVNIPKALMARACPRSSLMRCGATMNTAVWDAGYEGQSQALITVHNNDGMWVTVNARIAQIIFEELDDYVENGYDGIYQGEGVISDKKNE